MSNRLTIKDVELCHEDDKFVIVKHNYYYRDEAKGYSDYLLGAGIFTKDEALSHLKHCDELTANKIDVDEYTSLANKEIDYKQSRIDTIKERVRKLQKC